MTPIFCCICAFACHLRLFASKDEAAIVSQSMGDGRRDRACLGYGMAVGKVTGHSVISIKLGGRQEQRANAAFIPLSLPSTFSLFLLGRAALAGPRLSRSSPKRHLSWKRCRGSFFSLRLRLLRLSCIPTECDPPSPHTHSGADL